MDLTTQGEIGIKKVSFKKYVKTYLSVKGLKPIGMSADKNLDIP